MLWQINRSICSSLLELSISESSVLFNHIMLSLIIDMQIIYVDMKLEILWEPLLYQKLPQLLVLLPPLQKPPPPPPPSPPPPLLVQPPHPRLYVLMWQKTVKTSAQSSVFKIRRMLRPTVAYTAIFAHVSLFQFLWKDVS